MVAFVALASLLNCSGILNTPRKSTDETIATSSPPDAGTTFVPPKPFVKVNVSASLAKVKNALVGLPVTDGEISEVSSDPAKLKTLIDGWMKLPEFKNRSLGFFRKSFQQSDVVEQDLFDQLNSNLLGNPDSRARLLQNLQDSFALTAWNTVEHDLPFNQLITTDSLMMTPPLATFYAYLDQIHLADPDANGRIKQTLRIPQQYPNFNVTLQHVQGPIALSETVDPTSSNFMNWYVDTFPTTCAEDPRVYATGTPPTFVLFGYLFGFYQAVPNVATCKSGSGTGVFSPQEFDQWRMVKIRKPASPELPTPFFDVIKMRTASELVLSVPRVGFFTTPAYFANWPTNGSNQARVAANQTLIVALGHSIDGSNLTVPVAEPGLNAEHAAPGSTCYACHQTLDPMRNFFRQSFTLNYKEQLDPAQTKQQAVFTFIGVSQPGNGVKDLADVLANHSEFANAWVQKLCIYFNSAPCSVNDAEFDRVAKAFRDSNHNWKVLVRELASSPMVTLWADSKTYQTAAQVGVNRKEAYCAGLSSRIAIPDICGLSTPTSALTATQKKVASLAAVLPDDAFSRGAEYPSIALDPNLFFRASVEKICQALADQLVDVGAAPKYSSTNREVAFDDFVQNVMSIPKGDARYADIRAIVKSHYDDAVAQKISSKDALKSSFVVACTSPSSVAFGM